MSARTCAECGSAFESDHPSKKFCKRQCNQRAASRRHREANPGYFAQYHSGCSPVQYAAMMADQGGRCACCGDPMVKPCVDHDHVTGRVRALLCTGCNVGIGMFQESEERLLMAIEYLNIQKLAIGHAGNKTPAEKGLKG